MANTNGMRHPMTAKKEFRHPVTKELIRVGQVFDGMGPSHVLNLKNAGSAAVGDLTEPGQAMAGGVGAATDNNLNADGALGQVSAVTNSTSDADPREAGFKASAGTVAPDIPVLLLDDNAKAAQAARDAAKVGGENLEPGDADGSVDLKAFRAPAGSGDSTGSTEGTVTTIQTAETPVVLDQTGDSGSVSENAVGGDANAVLGTAAHPVAGKVGDDKADDKADAKAKATKDPVTTPTTRRR